MSNVKSNPKSKYLRRRRKNLKPYFIIGALAVTFVFALGAGAGYFYFQNKTEKNPENKNLGLETIPKNDLEIKTENIFVKFIFEVYETIQENYWEKISDEKLVELFSLGAEKILGHPLTLSEKNKIALSITLENEISLLPDDEEKEQFASRLSNMVLVNLKPFGRSLLYSEENRKELSERVNNINPETGQKEPTVYSKIIKGKIWHAKITTFSPSTLQEFQLLADEVDAAWGPDLDSLILDLRGNAGGSIDLLPYLLGPFIGFDQYAYEFYQQGEKISFKTLTGWLNSLVRYKKVVILIDNMTQSSAEVMASVLKKYNVGILVGVPTRGWGTVERVFDLENQVSQEKKYSIFLVHHLTLADDNEPIEGRGVEPIVNINEKDWQEKLFAYIPYQPLIDAVADLLAE